MTTPTDPIALALTDEALDAIIDSLDDAARAHSFYDYGLPLHERIELRAVARAALASLSAAPAAVSEPVAWRWRILPFLKSGQPARDAWVLKRSEDDLPQASPPSFDCDGFEVQPLYAAPPASAPVPDGWVLVPREPTEAMLLANGTSAVHEGAAWLREDGRQAWAAMLSAIPVAPPARPAAEGEAVARAVASEVDEGQSVTDYLTTGSEK